MVEVVPLMQETIDLGRAALACELGATWPPPPITRRRPVHLMWMTRVWAAHLTGAIRMHQDDLDGAAHAYRDLEALVDELGVTDPCVVPGAGGDPRLLTLRRAPG